MLETAIGTINGVADRGAWKFLGVPFAAPPIGARRFRHPHSVKAWAGIRDARHARPGPMQPNVVGLGMRGAMATDEDCLTLNIFTPSADANRRPVIVWIFGGAYTHGDAADPLFDGSRLASSEDVVVVTFNYRLGAFGFARIADDNCGLVDQIAALRFVVAHIERFGGDPDRVTIVGESAGAMSVCNLLAAPAARGLFHRAIAQSGAASNVGTAAQALEAATALRAALEGDVEHAPAQAVLHAQERVSRSLRGRFRALPFRPWVDGTWLEDAPLTVAGASDVPLIMGMNADENRLYVRPSVKVDDATLRAQVAHRVGEARASAVIEHYLRERPTPPINTNAGVLADIDTELRFRRPMLHYVRARRAPTWLYQFDWRSPALRGWLGACHAIEIPFVFGNFDARGTARFVGAGADADRLASNVMGLWAAFARDGRPPVSWPQYASTNERQLHLDHEIGVAMLDDDPTHRFWESLELQPS